MADGITIHAHGDDGIGVKDAVELTAYALGKDGYATTLHGSGGRTAAGSEEHDEAEQHPQVRRPLHIVGCGKARGGLQRYYLEEGYAERLLYTDIALCQQAQCDDEREAQHGEQVYAELGVAVQFA